MSGGIDIGINYFPISKGDLNVITEWWDGLSGQEQSKILLLFKMPYTCSREKLLEYRELTYEKYVPSPDWSISGYDHDLLVERIIEYAFPFDIEIYLGMLNEFYIGMDPSFCMTNWSDIK